MNLKDPRLIAVGTSSALVLTLGLLSVQHLRHGWPFSLHHGFGLRPTVASTAQRHDAAVGPAHPRVEIELDASQSQVAGVRVEKTRREAAAQPIRAMATIVPDEARVSHVHTRVSGWIEQLHVTTTGQPVRSGQALASIFSQELLSTQNDYLAARKAAASGTRSALVEGARSRLLVLGMTEAEISAIERTGEPRRLVTINAPSPGVVLHRGISAGTAVDPSTEILTIADLSRVWALVDVPEFDVSRVQVGTAANLEFPAAGGTPFAARVEFMYPTLSERTRTLRVRFAIANAAGTLRPGMYGSATFQVSPRPVLTAPRDAVIDTGDAQHVFVVAGEGRFAPRAVKLGARFGDRVEILEGLQENEAVVASGVFLIDSESRLRASGSGTGHQHGSDAHDTPEPAPRPRVRPVALPRPQTTAPSGHEGHSPAAHVHEEH